MTSRYARKLLTMAITAAAGSCLAASQALAAQNPATTAPNVIYTATGLFGSVLSGSDLYELSGEPFSLSVVANSATVPKSHGLTWAQYGGLKMTGSVNSGLLVGQPIPISSSHTSMELATGNPDYDVAVIFAPVSPFGAQINITATIHMPPGTIKNALIHPFTAPVALNPSNSTVTYAQGAGATTLTIGSGTLNAALQKPATQALTGVQLHEEGMRAVTSHGDGTATLRPVRSAPVDLGGQGDVTSLFLYASGVREASDVHVQIAGQDAPLLYAGPATHFPGLDEIAVQVPSRLAGSGDVEVLLVVDGEASNPVHIQIQ